MAGRVVILPPSVTEVRAGRLWKVPEGTIVIDAGSVTLAREEQPAKALAAMSVNPSPISSDVRLPQPEKHSTPMQPPLIRRTVSSAPHPTNIWSPVFPAISALRSERQFSNT